MAIRYTTNIQEDIQGIFNRYSRDAQEDIQEYTKKGIHDVSNYVTININRMAEHEPDAACLCAMQYPASCESKYRRRKIMRLKKLLTAVLGGVLVLASTNIVFADTTDAVVTYDFESDHGITLYGEAAVVENPDDSSDSVLLVDSSTGGTNGNYGLLPEGTLSGYDFSEGITVSVDVRPTLNSGNYNYIFCVGASGTATDVTSSGYAYVDGAIGLIARYGDTYEALLPYGNFVDGNELNDNDVYFLTDGTHDRWYNLTYTYSSTEIAIYVNGVKTVSWAPANSSDLATILANLSDEAAIVFGAGASRGDLENFGGYLDDLRIYEGTLTADEVASIVDSDAYELVVLETEEETETEEESEAAAADDAAADEDTQAEAEDTASEDMENASGFSTVALVIAIILTIAIVVLAVLYATDKLKISKNVLLAIVGVLAVVIVILLVVGLSSDGSSSSGSDASEDSETETSSASAYEPSTTLVEVYDVERSATERSGVEDGEVALAVSTYTNPVTGLYYDDEGNIVYGGDPSILVDGDTVYLYTGHDTATGNSDYVIPEYLCWSTTDLVNWTYEGVVMSADMTSITWASSSTSGWASQVAKHYDSESGKDMYYLYYCTWDKTASGKQSIGVAVSDSATGTFVDIGEPLVSGNLTADDETSGWNDIDPTVWIEYDDDGVEHRYLAWGNGQYYVCELNEDMVSVMDLNGDGEITAGTSTDDADIISGLKSNLSNYTEGPYLYRRSDEYGNYYGDYYLFYASGYREGLAYATSSNLLTMKWTSGSVIMSATATSNTNHPAVFDFKGHTYLIYHNGSIAGGSGFRRSACIVEIEFNDDGSISLMSETAAGVGGTVSQISLASGEAVGHEYYTNSASDDAYPYTDVACGLYEDEDPEWDGDFAEEDLYWVICEGKADTENAAYVSVQSENKPGLYLTANEDMTVTLAQEDTVSEDMEAQQTFHTVVGLNDEDGVSFESVAYPGYYLTIVDGVLMLTDGSDAENATFYVTTVEE